ncbi:Hsp20/alpha crystallin family protein [Prosthecobacter sp.]|uniref:Hsp20/alpha crystallin family protein n=1 Tax=Prosthecobacter sp. TaxID=1965333 RepID=UPI003785296B
MPRSIRLSRLFSMADQLAAQLQGLQFAGWKSPEALWRPDVNVYAHSDRLEVCVDLAGVNKQEIQVEAEPRRLVVRGQRQTPDGRCDAEACCRILVMEIPEGNFERVLEFPVAVDTERVTAKQENGWLWITLPIQMEEVS